MSLRYECPECGEEIVVRFLDVGEFAQCRHCAAESAVPEDAEVVDAPSTWAVPRVRSPNLPRSGADRRWAPHPRPPSRYWFLRALAWIILVGAALHILSLIVTIGQVPEVVREDGLVAGIIIWIPIEALIALGLAQGVWAILEIVANTRSVLPPPADTFE